MSAVYRFMEDISASYLQAMGRMEAILTRRDMVDRPVPGKIYTHRGAEVEVLAMHGTYCWVVEVKPVPYDELAQAHTPYTVHVHHLEEASFKPGDTVLPVGVMMGDNPNVVIAVDNGMVWHRTHDDVDLIDKAERLRRVP